MAYRSEKESNGKEAIVIDTWDTIAPDPYSGTGLMESVNLETPGEVSVGYALTSVTATSMARACARSIGYFPTYVTQGTPNGLEKRYAMLDETGQVFERSSASSFAGSWTFLSSSNSTTGSSRTDGLAYWLGFLFKFRNDKVDYWNGSTWTAGWQTITAGVPHFAYVGSDNKLYFTNGSYLGAIFAPDPDLFDPTDSLTYDFNEQLLRIPVNDVALSLAEVGGGNSPSSTLLVGGSLNAIYPWDKISTSFGLPIYVADSYIGKMISANQNAFIFPGRFAGRGRIYITNGSQADLYFKVPDYVFGYQDPYIVWGDAMFHRNNLVFGAYPLSNGGGVNIPSANVWALNLTTKAFRSISTQATATGRLIVGALIPIIAPEGTPLFPLGFGYFMGWNDDSSISGLSISNTSPGTGTTSTTLRAGLIPVGTNYAKRTFTQVEFKLRTPLASGETLTVTPIVDGTTGSALSFQPSITTNSISGVATVNFQGVQWLDFLVTLSGNSNASGVRLKELRVR